MANKEIDLIKLIKYLLRRVWVLLICALIGFAAMYFYTEKTTQDTYTASASMYVYNGNPNALNYQYTNVGDLSAAEQLTDTYAVVIRSNKVMDAVLERLGYDISREDIVNSIRISSVENTSVMKISSTTPDPYLSMDICNAVADIAPAEIVRVVNAGSVEVIDYASLPAAANSRGIMKKSAMGALAGLVVAGAVLVVMFLTNRKLNDGEELVDIYKLPLLTSIPKFDPKTKELSYYLLGSKTPSVISSAYAKLRMNVSFSIHNRRKILIISSAVPQETKSTVAANLAVSFSLADKKVLLIDGDMRKPTQQQIFGLDIKEGGLSEILVPELGREKKIWRNVRPNLDIVTAGTIPPNPSELMDSKEMEAFLKKSEEEYDIIILDTPPINVVTDALVFADKNVGMLFVSRCHYSDHREIRKALNAAEYTGIDIIGMVMTCADKLSDGYYNNKYYKKYYSSYDRNNTTID